MTFWIEIIKRYSCLNPYLKFFDRMFLSFLVVSSWHLAAAGQSYPRFMSIFTWQMTGAKVRFTHVIGRMFNFFPDLNIFLTHYIAKVKMQRKKGEKLDERNFCIMKMHPICVSSKKLFLWGKSRIKVAKQNKQVFLDVFFATKWLHLLFFF